MTCDKKHVLTPTIFVMKWKWQPIQHVISFWLCIQYLNCIQVRQRKAVRDAKSNVATILLLKAYQKWFLCYHLPCSFQILKLVFGFMYVQRQILRKAMKLQISFPSFFRKILMSAFLLRFKANYLRKNMWLPQFFFVNSTSPCKDVLFRRGPPCAKTVIHVFSRHCP